jgi:hypothetical protein
MARMKFWQRINRTDSCWLWTGPLSRDGYGVTHARKAGRAHRLSWMLHRGPIPPGLQLDHLCRVRHCVNPDHLELVTSRENTLRGDSPAARRARQTHCQRGHLFDDANTLVTVVAGRVRRRCKACRARYNHAYHLRRLGLTEVAA